VLPFVEHEYSESWTVRQSFGRPEDWYELAWPGIETRKYWVWYKRY
jgi:hypothetical protein